MKIHQIFINDSGKLPSSVPNRTLRCLESITNYFGNDRHIYCGEELEQFLTDNFTKEVFLSYKKLKSYSLRSDLARMCLLYYYGGLYSDIHLLYRHSLEEHEMNDSELCAFTPNSYMFRHGYTIHNAFLYAPKPGSKILERAIQYTIQNCRDEYYGDDLTEIAGSLCLGKAYYNCESSSSKSNLYILGEMINLIPNYHPMYMCGLVHRNYGLIAMHDKPADMRDTGLEGTNFHSEMWYGRDLYDTNIKF